MSFLWFTWIFHFSAEENFKFKGAEKYSEYWGHKSQRFYLLEIKMSWKNGFLEQRLEANNYILFAGDIRDPEELIKTLANFKIDFEFFKISR